jgi:hypothetical protein
VPIINGINAILIKNRDMGNRNQPLGFFVVCPKEETEFIKGEYPGNKKAAGINNA